jgi:anthraniloyl-CoA monooxygenase
MIGAGRADLCAIARGHLTEPSLSLLGANRYGVASQPWPSQYLPARRVDPR